MNDLVGSGGCAQYTPEGLARAVFEEFAGQEIMDTVNEVKLRNGLKAAIAHIDFVRQRSATHIRISEEEYLTLLRKRDLADELLDACKMAELEISELLDGHDIAISTNETLTTLQKIILKTKEQK